MPFCFNAFYQFTPILNLWHLIFSLSLFGWSKYLLACILTFTYLLTAWNTVLPEKLTSSQLVKNSPCFMEPKGSLLHSQAPTTWAIKKFSVWTFRNKVPFFYGEELLAPCPTPKLDDHPFSAVHDCLFSIFSATLHPQPGDAPCHCDRDRPIMGLVYFHLMKYFFMAVLVLICACLFRNSTGHKARPWCVGS